MSQTSHDAKAIVRALADLAEQVRRIADAQSAPVVRVGDGVRTTAGDRPRIGRPVALATPCGYCGHQYNWHASSGACEVGNEESCCGCDTFTVGERPEPIDPWRILGAEAPATDEDALRATRRESARIILDRATRGIALRSDESALLRQHFDAETREHDTARAVAAGNKRHVQTIVPEIDRLAAELEDHDRRVEHLEELLPVAHETSNRSEAERAAAVQRAEQADAVTAETKRLLERRTTTLRERAERAEDTVKRVHAARDRMANAKASDVDAIWCLDLVDAALNVGDQPTTEA